MIVVSSKFLSFLYCKICITTIWETQKISKQNVIKSMLTLYYDVDYFKIGFVRVIQFSIYDTKKNLNQ